MASVVTPLAAKPRRALAVEVVLQVDALCAVQAGAGGARVQVVLAVGAGETAQAGAEVEAAALLLAGAAVPARVGTAGARGGQLTALELDVVEALQSGNLEWENKKVTTFNTAGRQDY